MPITHSAPNTIWLGGPRTVINDLAANEVITPGTLVERYTSSGKLRLRKHATIGGSGTQFAADQSALNKGVDDTYAINDLCATLVGASGTAVWALLLSGQNVAFGAKLESAGTGALRFATTTGAQTFRTLEAVDNSAGVVNARIRVEVE